MKATVKVNNSSYVYEQGKLYIDDNGLVILCTGYSNDSKSVPGVLITSDRGNYEVGAEAIWNSSFKLFKGTITLEQ